MAETGHILLIVYIKRNPSLSRAEFYDHWKDVHGPKVIPWAEKHGIRRYQQAGTSQQRLLGNPTSLTGQCRFTLLVR
jgi:hypothetical protein